MTPKDRLKRLESYSVCDNYREKEEDFKEIEKALEVLEILKSNAYLCTKIELYMQLDSRYLNIRIREKDYKTIKKWLEDD